jgi:ABC-type uncharacterized transport system substrate-binding protein
MRQVGFLYPGPQAGASSRVAAFMSGLQSGGLPAEQVTIVLRVTGGDAALLGPMAADLVAGKVDLIFAIGPAAVRAARGATTNIPIVAGDLESDPLSTGFISAHMRQEGVLAAKILLGANPAETPIETPTRFEFVLNLKTAKLLGLVIPASTLLRADEVIE